MIEIREILDPNIKSMICNEILRSLPNWFGVEASIIEYVRQVQSMPFFVACVNDKAIGFLSLKTHNSFTSEIYVMGVLKEYQRQGVGKKLVEYSVNFCKKNHTEFITVKTLDKSRESKSYEKTRLFYEAMGFKPLEVFPLLWDKDNPCLYLIKVLSSG